MGNGKRIIIIPHCRIQICSLVMKHLLYVHINHLYRLLLKCFLKDSYWRKAPTEKAMRYFFLFGPPAAPCALIGTGWGGGGCYPHKYKIFPTPSSSWRSVNQEIISWKAEWSVSGKWPDSKRSLVFKPDNEQIIFTKVLSAFSFHCNRKMKLLLIKENRMVKNWWILKGTVPSEIKQRSKLGSDNLCWLTIFLKATVRWKLRWVMSVVNHQLLLFCLGP